MNRIIYGLWSILILFSSHYEMNSSCKWPVLKLKKKMKYASSNILCEKNAKAWFTLVNKL